MENATLISEMKKTILRMPEHAQAYIAMLQQKGSEVVTKDEPYFSRVRFEPVISVDGSNNATYSFSSGQAVQAFAYGQGGSMAIAGFNAAGTGYGQATPADTNLQQSAGKLTNGADLVFIESLCIIPTPKSDPVLTKLIIADISVSCGFSGSVSDVKLGQPLMWPGSAGLFGQSNSKLQPPNVNDQTGVVYGTLCNGLPGAGDTRWMKDPLVWMPQTESDSQFALQLKLERALAYTANARTAGTNNIPTAVTPPATAGAEGTYVEFLVYLIGAQIGPRGRNR